MKTFTILGLFAAIVSAIPHVVLSPRVDVAKVTLDALSEPSDKKYECPEGSHPRCCGEVKDGFGYHCFARMLDPYVPRLTVMTSSPDVLR